MKRKWEIEKLKGSKQLKKSANLILKNRIESLSSYTEKYFKAHIVENLHDVRIALRRVRYSMELFIVCYDKKVYLKFYNKVQSLQDISGAVRDVDITIENINSLFEVEHIKIDPGILKKAEEKKILLEEKFKIDLMKFTLNKAYKDFLKQISEYENWLRDHPDADPVAISEIRKRLQELNDKTENYEATNHTTEAIRS